MKKDKNIIAHDRELFKDRQEEATKTRSELAQYGVYDQSTADKAIKLVLNGDANVKEAASIAQYNKYVDKQSLMDDSVRVNIEQGVLEKVGNIDQTRRIMELTDKFNDVVPQKTLAIERMSKKLEKEQKKNAYDEKKKKSSDKTKQTKKTKEGTKKPRTTQTYNRKTNSTNNQTNQ